MTLSNKVLIPAAALILLFLVVNLFVPSSLKEQSSYRFAAELFSIFLLLFFAYTRKMPEQRNLRTACFIALAGTIAGFAGDRVGRGAIGSVLQGLSALCFLTGTVLFVLYFARRQPRPASIK